jgi:GxxExxY protein
MASDELRAEINRVTEKIINCAYRVSNALGSGFLEKVYENALAIELRQSGLRVVPQHPIKVYYNENLVGDYMPIYSSRIASSWK